VVGGLALLAVIVPPVARLVIRRRRWRRGARGGDAGLAHVAWQELQDDLIDYRAGYSPSETPRALRTRVAALVTATAGASAGAGDDGAGAGDDGAGSRDEPGASLRDGPQDILDGRADVVEVGAPDEAPRGGLARASASRAGIAALERIAMAEERARYAARPVSGSGLRRDSAVVRRAIAATTTRRDRWRARLLPSSVLTPTASGVSQAADVFGRLSLRRGDDMRHQANGLTDAGRESRSLERVSQ
jgi:hypothetical protein